MAFARAAPAVAEAPPEASDLTFPANHVSGVTAGSELRAGVADPNGGDLDVAFHWRKVDRQASAAKNFTIVTLPDTQNYSSAAANLPQFKAQTEWIATTKSQLNTLLVTHLGDVVGMPDVEFQFQRAVQALSTLDDAKIPYTVIPGNHDMDVRTGDAALYDQYFPPSKFQNWANPNVRYGGDYGQNQFGADERERKNMNSYVLVDQGDLNFMILNLEFNAPNDVLAWADRVIDAHPDRRVMVVTHNMLHVDGKFGTSVERPEGNDPRQVLEKLIAPNCQVDIVINGHNSDGILGEANTRMKNSCQEPVIMALSNYQGRPNGGDGWLRYYTFQPNQNRILARTYSPTLRIHETDVDSQFEIPYDMSGSATEFTQLRQTTPASGTTVKATLPVMDADSDYEWYVTASDGSSTSTSPTWSFSTRKATDPDP